MDAFMYMWSWLFSPVIGAMLFVLLFLILLMKKRLRDALSVGLASAATLGIVELLKNSVNRPRPRIDPTLWATSPSFPSGHAAESACFALLAAWFLVPARYRKEALLTGIIITLLVGGSRLYFNVHYLSDILAGYAIGIAMAGSAIIIDRRTKMR